MTKSEAISLANYLLHERGRSTYLMRRRGNGYSESDRYFVLTEQNNVAEGMQFAEVIQYVSQRCLVIDMDKLERRTGWS